MNIGAGTDLFQNWKVVVIELTDEQHDILREIAHIGAGNASEALSEMTGQKAEVAFPWLGIKEIQDIPDMLGGAQQVVTAVSLDVGIEEYDGSASGKSTLILSMDEESADRLANQLVGPDTERDGEDAELTEMQRSALKEAGNILAGNCMTAITEYVDLKMVEEVPRIKTDMLGAIMDNVLLEMAAEHDELLVFKTKFSLQEDIDAYFIFFFADGAHHLILDRLTDG